MGYDMTKRVFTQQVSVREPISETSTHYMARDSFGGVADVGTYYIFIGILSEDNKVLLKRFVYPTSIDTLMRFYKFSFIIAEETGGVVPLFEPIKT